MKKVFALSLIFFSIYSGNVDVTNGFSLEKFLEEKENIAKDHEVKKLAKFFFNFEISLNEKFEQTKKEILNSDDPQKKLALKAINKVHKGLLEMIHSEEFQNAILSTLKEQFNPKEIEILTRIASITGYKESKVFEKLNQMHFAINLVILQKMQTLLGKEFGNFEE